MRLWRLLLLLPFIVGAAPSRTCSYVTGQIIESSCVSENEDNVFSYLQTGPDTFRTSSIPTAALQDGAVTAAKLDTGAVTTTIILDGTIANADLAASSVTSSTINDGTVVSADIANSTIAAADMADGDHGDFTYTSNVAAIDANAVALSTDTTGNYVATVADAGNSTITVSGSGSEGAAVTVDAVDVNCSNCIDGTDIALGSDAQGDVMYYNGTDWVRLGAGTDGQFLETNGVGANPTWSTVAPIYQYATGSWNINESTTAVDVLTAGAGKRWFLLAMSINITDAVDAGNTPVNLLATLDDDSTVTIEAFGTGTGAVGWNVFDLLHHHLTDANTSDTAATHTWETDSTAFWTNLDGRYIKKVSIQHTGGTGATVGTIYAIFLEF